MTETGAVAAAAALLQKPWVAEDPCAGPIFEDLEDELQYHRRRSFALHELTQAFQPLFLELKQLREENEQLHEAGANLQDEYLAVSEEISKATGDVAYWKELAESLSSKIDAKTDASTEEPTSAKVLTKESDDTTPLLGLPVGGELHATSLFLSDEREMLRAAAARLQQGESAPHEASAASPQPRERSESRVSSLPWDICSEGAGAAPLRRELFTPQGSPPASPQSGSRGSASSVSARPTLTRSPECRSLAAAVAAAGPGSMPRRCPRIGQPLRRVESGFARRRTLTAGDAAPGATAQADAAGAVGGSVQAAGPRRQSTAPLGAPSRRKSSGAPLRSAP